MLHTMIPSPEYWNAVAQSIDAEDAKASLFIHHKASIGTAREEILKDFLRKRTPEPYRVRSGFVHRLHEKGEYNYCSPQLDVVVYNAMTAQPDYEIGNLVVVPGGGFGCASAIAEVKTHLDFQQFDGVLKTWEKVAGLLLPTFVFAFDGVAFETFVDFLTTAMKEKPWGIPDCIAVHRQNYLFVREGYNGQPHQNQNWHRTAKLQLAVNFGPTMQGHTAGTLLYLFLDRLKSHTGFNQLKNWFNTLPLPQDTKLSFSDSGEVTTGDLA